MKKIAILQSNYIPWKGYFDMINSVDEFIFYDEMQYTKNDWRNRNKIKSPAGLHWLTIAVKQHSLQQKINETEVQNPNWAKKHLETIKQFYRKAPFFSTYKDWLEEIYGTCTYQNLSEINFHFIRSICDMLDIKTRLSWSHDYGLIEGKTERLVDLVQKAGGSAYVSGPAARDYLDDAQFTAAGISLSWMDYSRYPEYEQLYPPFEHGVSIIDLILNTGSDAKKFFTLAPVS
jgi:hypothetical protein